MAAVLAMTMVTVPAASALQQTIVAASDDSQVISVTIDGRPVDFDGQRPIVQDGRTLVPVRGVFEELGFTVGRNGSLRQVTLTSPDYTVILTY